MAKCRYCVEILPEASGEYYCNKLDKILSYQQIKAYHQKPCFEMHPGPSEHIDILGFIVPKGARTKCPKKDAMKVLPKGEQQRLF